jgi:hypothetical protein
MSAIELRRLLVRVLIAMLVMHGLWWMADVDQRLLALLKVPMEVILPALIDDVVRVTQAASPGGGWALLTSVKVNGGANLSLLVGNFVLAKSVFWIPSALALTLATTPRDLARLLLCAVIAIVIAAILIVVCSAAQLAIFLNPEPGIWADLNPRSPGLVLSVAPYPDWLFFLLSLGFYFTLNVAMLALPVVLWVIVCWREIGTMLRPQ